MEKNELIKYDEDYFICVSNAFVKANQNLSLNESKLLRLMISQIVVNDKELRMYTIKIPELADILNISTQNLYRDIDKMTSSLMQQIIKINTKNSRGKVSWIKFQIFNTCKYKDGLLTMKLHDELRPFLIELKNLYTQYQISTIIGMKSTYAIRIYELLKEKRRNNDFVKEDESLEIDIEDIRVATNTLDKYSITDFKKNVLDISVREISCNSEFAIDYEYVKKGRKVAAIKFNIYSHSSPRGTEILENHGINSITGCRLI